MIQMIKLPSYFIGFSSKADGSASLRFSTQEITSNEFKNLKDNLNSFGWLLFSENAKEDDIPKEDPEEEGISSSERLRRRMYVYWKKEIKKGDFESWRKNQMELLGQRYLEKIND